MSEQRERQRPFFVPGEVVYHLDDPTPYKVRSVVDGRAVNVFDEHGANYRFDASELFAELAE